MASVTYAVNHIGNHPNNLRRLDAHLRDFRLYDQALSDAEFGALYTSSLDFCSVPRTITAVPETTPQPTPPPGFTYQKRVTKVTTTMSVPLTVEEFTVDAQREYKETVAAVVGVHVDQVNIVSVTAE